MPHTKPNILLIDGNTYSHKSALADAEAVFDSSLKMWKAPIDSRIQMEELCLEKGLKLHEDYDPSYSPPASDQERTLQRVKSLRDAARVRKLEVQNKISAAATEQERTALEDSLQEVEEAVTRYNEQIATLEKVAEQGGWTRLIFQSLEERGLDWFKSDPPKQRVLLRYSLQDQHGNETESVPFLPAEIVGMICGSGGAGKTRLLAQLAIAVSTGTPFLRNFQVEEGPGKVFLGLGEEPEAGMHRRLHAAAQLLSHQLYSQPIGAHLPLAATNIVAQSFRGMDMQLVDDDGSPTSQFNQLLDGLKSSSGPDGYRLIILDPLARFLSGETEKDANAATKLIALLERLTIEVPGNPTVIVGHHANKQSDKDDQGSARGSSAITDGVRWQVNLWTPCKKDKSRISELRALQHAKVNDVQFMPKPLMLKFGDRGILVPASKPECESLGYESGCFTGYSQRESKPKSQKKTSTNAALAG